jgi:LacI family transcriptional regulator
MPRTRRAKEGHRTGHDPSLALLACPNPDCLAFNRFDAGNLSVCERMGKDKSIRRLYCKQCHTRFSERQGSLMQYTKLPQPAVVRIIKCLGHGCTLEATADICEVDPRTVQRMLETAGQRAEDFHRLQLEKLDRPLEAVQLDELHARVCNAPTDRQGKKGDSRRMAALLRRIAARGRRGFTLLWR